MNLSAMLHRTAVEHAGNKAIVFQGQEWTYKELEERINAFAAGLAALGLKKGSRVGMLMGNCPEFVITYFAIARLGAASVPVNPTFTPGELQFILSDAEVEAVVAVAPMAPMFAAMMPVLPSLQHVILVGGDGEGGLAFDALSGDAAALPAVEIAENELATILYTSGTTGKPKGAMLSHRNLISNAEQAAEMFLMTPEDKMVAVLPIFHIFCLTVCMNGPITVGATILLEPRFSPTETAKMIREMGATVFAGVPTMYNFLFQHPDVQSEDLKSIRLCIAGGASLPLAVLAGFEQKFNAIITEGYGLSEAAPAVTFNPVNGVRKPGSIGLPIKDVEVRIMREDGKECETHEVGELICRGPNVMLGYLNRPEETALTLRDGWLYTGDLATKDEDGYVTIVDRKKDMIIVGGFNVYPREVEEVLFKHPQVREAAVIGMPDPNYGEQVKAFVALKEGELSIEALIAYCGEHLVSYKVPKEIVILEELPKNTTGKILRRELKNVNSQPAG